MRIAVSARSRISAPAAQRTRSTGDEPNPAIVELLHEPAAKSHLAALALVMLTIGDEDDDPLAGATKPVGSGHDPLTRCTHAAAAPGLHSGRRRYAMAKRSNAHSCERSAPALEEDRKTAKQRGRQRRTTGAKKSAGKRQDGAAERGKRKTAAKRETIDTGTDKRYVRRGRAGQFKESDDVSRSLSVDARKKAKTKVKKGQGDRGDR